MDAVHASGLERLRRVFLSGVTGVGATGLTAAISLISIPLTIHYLGPVRYGVWVIINSMLTWLSVSSMGLSGTALVNTLADARGHGDAQRSRQLVSSAIFALSVIAGLLAILFAVSFSWAPWLDIVNARGSMEAQELHAAIVLSVLFFLLMFPLGALDAVYYGYQEGYISNVWNVIGSIVSLGALIVVTKMEGGLPLLVIAMIGTKWAVCIINMIVLFGWIHPEVRPAWACIKVKALRELAGLGGKYLVQQLAGLGMFQVQPLLITRFLGPEPVGIYNVALRLLTIPLMFVSLFSMPLIPAYGEARARADWPWILKTLRRSLILTIILAALMLLPLAVVTPWIVGWWMGPAMLPPTAFICLLTLYVLVNAALTPLAIFFTGLQWMGSQAVIAVINAAINIGFAIYILRPCGLSGMGWAMLAGILSNGAGQLISLWVFQRQPSNRKAGGS